MKRRPYSRVAMVVVLCFAIGNFFEALIVNEICLRYTIGYTYNHKSNLIILN